MSPQEQAKVIFLEHLTILEFFKIPEERIEAKKHALLSIKKIISALEEYDNSTEKYLKEEFGKEYFSSELQNMDSDFRYWSKVKYELEIMKVS